MNQCIVTPQGWLSLGFIILINFVAYFVAFHPEKMSFLKQFPHEHQKLLGRSYFVGCTILDALLIFTTVTDKYPFN